MYNYIDKLHKPGFSFENTLRNSTLISPETLKTQLRKTGTTIVGVTCPEGVIIAADTRATSSFISEKNINKILTFSSNIKICGAGTAADCFYFVKKISAQAELLRRNTGRETLMKTVVCKMTGELFRYGGQLGCHLILAGYDAEGPHLV